eukprot:1840220-Rhodomonas_salina.5
MPDRELCPQRQQSTHKHDAANTVLSQCQPLSLTASSGESIAHNLVLSLTLCLQGAAQPLPVSQPRDVLRAIPGFTSLLSQPAQVAQPSKPAVAPIVHVDITAAARAPPPPPVAAPSKAVQPAPKPAAMPERRDGAKPSSGGGVWVVSAEMQALLAEQPSLSEEQKGTPLLKLFTACARSSQPCGNPAQLTLFQARALFLPGTGRPVFGTGTHVGRV